VDEGGDVFSFSLLAAAGRSLLDRFILANRPERFVDDLDFLGDTEPSFVFTGLPEAPSSLLVLGAATLFCLLFGGDEGGDCRFPCLSLRGLDLEACG